MVNVIISNSTHVTVYPNSESSSTAYLSKIWMANGCCRFSNPVTNTGTWYADCDWA